MYDSKGRYNSSCIVASLTFIPSGAVAFFPLEICTIFGQVDCLCCVAGSPYYTISVIPRKFCDKGYEHFALEPSAYVDGKEIHDEPQDSNRWFVAHVTYGDFKKGCNDIDLRRRCDTGLPHSLSRVYLLNICVRFKDEANSHNSHNSHVVNVSVVKR